MRAMASFLVVALCYLAVPADAKPIEGQWSTGKLLGSLQPVAYYAVPGDPALILLHQKQGASALWLSVLPGPKRTIDSTRIVDVLVGRELVQGQVERAKKINGVSMAVAPLNRTASIALWGAESGSCTARVAKILRAKTLSVTIFLVDGAPLSLTIPTAGLQDALRTTLSNPCRF